MSWANLFGRLASDLISGRGANSAIRNARYNLGRIGEKGVSDYIKNSGEQKQKAAEQAQTSDEAAFVLIKAMIAAAAADGEIDTKERANITERATLAGLTAQQQQRLDNELSAPASPEQIAQNLLGNDPEMVYRVSLSVIDLDEAAEFAHLRRLAKALGLDAAKVATIHNELGAPAP